MDLFVLNSHNIKQVTLMLKDCAHLAGDSDEITVMKFKTALHCRHDYLHIAVCELLGEVAMIGSNRKIKDVFNIPIPDNISNLSPDIITLTETKLIIRDVTISSQVEHTRQDKIEKYNQLKIIAEELNLDFAVYIIALRPSLENLFNEFLLAEIKPNDDVIKSFYNFYNSASRIIEGLKPFVKISLFEHYELGEPIRSELKSGDEYIECRPKTHLDSLAIKTNWSDIQTVMDTIKLLSEDDMVISTLADRKHDVNDFNFAFEQLDNLEPESYTHPKPTFHILFTGDPFDIPRDNKFSELKSDQQNSLNILKFITHLGIEGECFKFLTELYDNIIEALKFKAEKRIFESGFFTGTYQGDHLLKSKIAEQLGISDKDCTGVSIRKNNHLAQLKLNSAKPYFERSHQINIALSDPNARLFDNKAGVSFKNKHPAGRVYKPPTSCPPQCAESYQSFIKLMSKSSWKTTFDPILNCPLGNDAKCAMFFKDECRQRFNDFLKIITSSHFYNMSYATMLLADQAIHYSSLNTKKESYCLANTGLAHILHIFHGGSLPRSHDVGQPFFSIAITKNIDWSSDVFGDHKVYPFTYKGNTGYIVITGWRRLQIHKLSLLRDQYYSCLSTGFDTFCRNQQPRGSRADYLFFLYGFKTLVAQATSQRAAEFLMDVRYVVMSCYADYTNVSALIKEKFSPHYPTSFTRWIISILRSKVNIIQQAYQSTKGFSLNQPIFAGENRVQSSLGGDIDFPSLWGNYRLRSLQDLFDELFVYVLTGKEPSSQYHESIKSIETILSFQTLHDNLTIDEQNGQHDFNSLRANLINSSKIFYWSDAVFQSANLVSKTIDVTKVKKHIEKNVQLEVLSELESTKACIPEYEVVEDLDYKPPEQSLDHLRQHLIQTGFRIIGEYKYQPYKFKDVVKGSPVNPNSKSGRAKVHDLQLDMLIRHPELHTTLDLAHWNMLNNNAKVEAHICIKAQYGAKREFYVVNHGAKAQVRIFENTFKSIAKFIDSEMISVPGDQKMLHMSQAVNRTIKESKNRDDFIMYTNGDCTKWSACETMGSFMSMVRGFGEILSKDLQEFCITHLSSWACKKIKIPSQLLRGTHFITEKTMYINNEGVINSTQNFLQGMFNYSSSVKSVCATELAIKAWVYKWGHLRPISVKHLEHSDDYVLIIRVRDVKDFEDFRIIHKICQRLHGIVDSEKKTNSQRFIMEFISLVCFNGQLSYPHIKKTKETGINIAGLGYQTDIMNVVSRAGESVRLGVPQCSAYIQSLLQAINIYRKYSLQKNGRNESQFSIDPFNTPIELFGMPDCMPVFYLNTLGDPNNYRIYRYGDIKFKHFFWGLYLYSKKVNVDLSIYSDHISSFKNYNFVFKKTGARLQQIRKNMNWSFNEVQSYINANPEYILMKPRDTDNYRLWLQYMYYNPSFSIAYTQLSKRMVMLRLSFFSSGRCISGLTTDNIYTLKEFQDIEIPKLMDNSEINTKFLKLTLLNSDPNIEAYFELLDGAQLIKTGSRPLPTSVFKIPESYSFLALENDLSTVIQYTFSPTNFLRDQRRHLGELSLERDKSKIVNLVGDSKKGPSTVLTLHRLLKSQKKKYTIGISFSPTSHLTPGDMFRGYLEGGLEYNSQYQLYTLKEFVVHNPITNAPIYSRDFLYEHDRNSLILEQMSLLYYFIIVKLYKPVSFFREAITHVYDKFTGKQVQDILKTMKFDLTTQTDQFHKRMYCFMKYILEFDNQPLNELTEHAFGIRHAYLDRFDLEELQVMGLTVDDAVIFSFRGITFLGVIQKNVVYTLSQSAGPSTQLLSLLIAQRLFNLMTQNVFEKQFTERLDYAKMITSNNLMYNKTLNRLILKKGGNLAWGIQESGFNTYTGYPTPIKQLPKFLAMPFTPIVDIETATVRNNKTKLFCLPFWPCGSSQVLNYENFDLGRGLNMSLLNENKLLYSYFHVNELSVIYDDKIISSVSKAFGEVSLSHFKIPNQSSSITRKETPVQQDLDFNFSQLGDFVGNIELEQNDNIDISFFQDDLDFPDMVEEINVEDTRGAIEPINITDDIMELNDFQDEIELDISDDSNEADLSSNSDEEPFIQLLERHGSGGFVMQHIQSLPPIHVYILRCHTNYEILRFIRKPNCAFELLKLAKKMSENWGVYTDLEKCLIGYIVYEINEVSQANSYNNQFFKIGNKIAYFQGTVINFSMRKTFFTEAAAIRAAKNMYTMYNDDEGNYIVDIPLSIEEELKIWKETSIEFNVGKHKVWKVISDLRDE